MKSMSLVLLTFAACAAAGGQLLFKLGARGRQDLLEFVNLPITAGFVLYGIGTLVWIYALSYEKLVNVYAFTALTFVIVYLAGVFVVGEKISIAGVCGILLVLAGLYLITQYNV